MDRVIHKGKQVVTNARGAFAFDDLIPQLKFDLTFRHGRRRLERVAKSVEARIEVKPSECRDLGAITVN